MTGVANGQQGLQDDVIKWKHFPRYCWPFVRRIHLSPMNSPHKGQWRFDVFFDLRLNIRLSKQSWGWWFETPSRPLWCYCNWLRFACTSTPMPYTKRDIQPAVLIMALCLAYIPYDMLIIYFCLSFFGLYQRSPHIHVNYRSIFFSVLLRCPLKISWYDCITASEMIMIDKDGDSMD